MDARSLRDSIAMSSAHDPNHDLGDVQLLGNGTFVVEVTTTEDETYYLIGTIKDDTSYTIHKSPQLDWDEDRMFESVKADVLPKVMEAQENNVEEFDLFALDDFPDLFPNQDLDRTLESNAAMNNGKYLKVVHAFTDLLELLGYRIGKKKLMGGPDMRVKVYAREQ